jgi:hypothetical protein
MSAHIELPCAEPRYRQVVIGSVRRYVRADLIAWVRAQLPSGRPQIGDAEADYLEAEREAVFGP